MHSKSNKIHSLAENKVELIIITPLFCEIDKQIKHEDFFSSRTTTNNNTKLTTSTLSTFTHRH